MVVDCGCEFVPNKMLFEAGHSVPRSYEIKAGTGSGYIRPMEAELKKIPSVTIRTRCKMDDFVVDETGAVVGITARTGYRFNAKLVNDDRENKTGKAVTIRAKKGVMLAAGGFSRDIEFPSGSGPARRSLDRLDEPARRHGRRPDQGHGHRRSPDPALLAAVPPVLQPA